MFERFRFDNDGKVSIKNPFERAFNHIFA